MAATAIGSMLLQPQKLQRATGKPPEAELVEDMLSLLLRAGVAGAEGEPIGTAFEGAILAAVTRLLQHTGGGLAHAEDHLKTWLQPILDLLGGFAQAGEALSDPVKLADGAAQAVQQLAQFADALTVETLRTQIDLFVDVLEQDLGLTSTFLEEQIWAFVDDVVAGLATPPPGESAAARDNRLALISVLRRI